MSAKSQRASQNGFSKNEEREKPWGTAHAILQAKDCIDGHFAVINADDFYGTDSYGKLVKYFSDIDGEEGSDEFCMVGFPLKNTLSDNGAVNRGVCKNDSCNILTEVVEIEKIEKLENGARCADGNGGWVEFSGEEYASMNLWGFSSRVFKDLEQKFDTFLKENGSELKSEYCIPTVVDELISDGQVKVKILETDSQWFGVTYKEDKEPVVSSINGLIAQGVYPNKLWSQWYEV